MQTPTRNITKYEMLLAIAMSEYYKTTHVMFIPPLVHYIDMLKILRNKKFIEPLGESYFKLTTKAWQYIKRQQKGRFEEADNQIDAFIANL